MKLALKIFSHEIDATIPVAWTDACGTRLPGEIEQRGDRLRMTHAAGPVHVRREQEERTGT
jgi:hypothetical protein